MRGHAAGKSRTFPYEASRVGSLWVMRDAPRKNPRDYRKEEWIAHARRRHGRWTRLRDSTRVGGSSSARSLASESRTSRPGPPTSRSAIGCSRPKRSSCSRCSGFRSRLRLCRSKGSARLSSPRGSERRRERGRSRTSLLGKDAPFRQYVALDGDDIVGRVRSVDAAGAIWCADMHVKSRTGGAESGRRCSPGCCGTTGRAARRARCYSQVTPARSSIRASATSGSASCSCSRRRGEPHSGFSGGE